MKKTAARISIALILLAITLLILWQENLRLWQAGSFVVVVLAAREWGKLAGFEGHGNMFYTGWFALFAVIGEILFTYNHTAREIFLFAVSFFWAAVVPWCLLRNRYFGRIVQGTLGILLLFAAWHAAAILFVADINLLLAVLILVWVADTTAYFGGRRLGLHALAPAISPGKTREGLLVGLSAVFLCAGGAFWLFPDIPPAWLLAAAFSLFCLSVLGDLFESMNKRQAGVKDSGSLLGAHGGVLDRVDAMVPVLPFAALLSSWLV